MSLDLLLMNMSKNYDKNAYDKKMLNARTTQESQIFQEITKLWRNDWLGNV
jgi:hypothetical protein